MPVWASYGPRTGIFNVFHILRDPYGALAWPARLLYGALIIDKNPERASFLAVRGPYGLFTGCLQPLNPYGARKLIMQALKLYGPRTGRQNSYGASPGPCRAREWTYDFCSKQPGTAREQPARGLGVWCDWGITRKTFPLDDVIMTWVIAKSCLVQNINCGAITTRSIFSQILTVDTPQPTHEGEISVSFVSANPNSYFACRTVYNKMEYWTALQRQLVE